MRTYQAFRFACTSVPPRGTGLGFSRGDAAVRLYLGIAPGKERRGEDVAVP